MAKKKASKSSSLSKKNEDILCKLSLIMAVFFVMTAVPEIGIWIVSVRWWVWLVLAIIIGWKPMKHWMKNR